jgi:hypothetical protein
VKIIMAQASPPCARRCGEDHSEDDQRGRTGIEFV